MDLLGDLGMMDQLTSARTENAVLQQRVRELTEEVQRLRIDKETLLAEVEMYRKEAALPSFSKLALGGEEAATEGGSMDEEKKVFCEDFLLSGNGVFPKDNQVTLSKLHANANPSCCSLSCDDTVLATGGADATLRLVQWGSAWGDDSVNATETVMKTAAIVPFDAPVICVAFSPTLRNVLAAGAMDGSVQLLEYTTDTPGKITVHVTKVGLTKHSKYVRSLAWAPLQSILASASADGDVYLYKVDKPDPFAMLMDDQDGNAASSKDLRVTALQSLHLPGPVESICFYQDQLICHARGTPYLSYFDLDNGMAPSRIQLMADDHVSFCIMDMHMHGKYLAAATDMNRNLVLDVTTGQIIRNFYGHLNDCYSNPKVVWSRSGQYLMGNTQADGSLCVWDVASSRLVEQSNTDTSHAQTIRDLCAGNVTDCLVTTSFDKQTKFWFAPASE